MDRFFLFCFRSCLKGDNVKEYYEVLEIDDPRSATAEQIKRQYKKLSLTHHPDKLAQKGIEVTHEHKARFLRLKEAYDVLSEPKRRKIYDEYGLSGLKLMENPTEINHLDLLRNFQKNRGDRSTLALFIFFVFAAILLLPILFALKCDGTLGSNAPWVAIWSPMWFGDLLLLGSAIAILSDKGSKPNEQQDEDHPEEIPSDKIPLPEKIFQFTITILFILLQIFILVKLDDYTSWSWFAVFAPWFAYEGVNIIYHFPGAFLVSIVAPNTESTPFNVEEGAEGIEEQFMNRVKSEAKYFEQVMERERNRKSLLVFILRIWLAIFLAVQLDGIVDWDWGLVLLPIWIYLFMQYVLAYIYQSWGASKLAGLDIERIMAQDIQDPSEISRFQQGTELQSHASFLCLGQIFPLFMAIMLVCRLQVNDYSTFFIILPVFLVLGSCCCLVFCGLCCLSFVDTEGLEEEMLKSPASGEAAGEGGETGTNGVYVPPQPDAEAGHGNATVVPPEYGTFVVPPASEIYQSPLQSSRGDVDLAQIVVEDLHGVAMVSNKENKVTEEKGKQQQTTIDPDID